MKTPPGYSIKFINVILRLVYDVYFAAILWCQFCHHIINFFTISSRHVSCFEFDWSMVSILPPHHHVGYLLWLELLRFISNLSEPKKTLKSLFPTLHFGQNYWELLIIEGRFVIIKRLRKKSQPIICQLYL